jgi:hypothetical protein
LSAATSDEQAAWEATWPRRRSGLAADKNVRAPALPVLCSQLASNLDYWNAEKGQSQPLEDLSLNGDWIEGAILALFSAMLYPDSLVGGEELTQIRRDSLRNAEEEERKCSSPPRCSAPSASLR